MYYMEVELLSNMYRHKKDATAIPIFSASNGVKRNHEELDRVSNKKIRQPYY